MKKLVLFAASIMFFFPSSPMEAQESDKSDLMKARKIAGEITELRSVRAASLLESGDAVTPDVFKQVCGPVKKKAMEIAQREGVRIRHAAVKNRNPDHAASDEEKEFHRIFEKGLEKELWNETVIDGRKYSRYVSPVYVEPACLACHGEKDSRPAFVREKYPQDKAFGFDAGDLRGVIEVMMAQEK